MTPTTHTKQACATLALSSLVSAHRATSIEPAVYLYEIGTTLWEVHDAIADAEEDPTPPPEWTPGCGRPVPFKRVHMPIDAETTRGVCKAVKIPTVGTSDPGDK